MYDSGTTGIRPSRHQRKKALIRAIREFALHGKTAYKGRVIRDEASLTALSPAALQILAEERDKIQKIKQSKGPLGMLE